MRRPGGHVGSRPYETEKLHGWNCSLVFDRDADVESSDSLEGLVSPLRAAAPERVSPPSRGAQSTHRLPSHRRHRIEPRHGWLDRCWRYLIDGVSFGVIVGLSEAVWLPLFTENVAVY